MPPFSCKVFFLYPGEEAFPWLDRQMAVVRSPLMFPFPVSSEQRGVSEGIRIRPKGRRVFWLGHIRMRGALSSPSIAPLFLERQTGEGEQLHQARAAKLWGQPSTPVQSNPNPGGSTRRKLLVLFWAIREAGVWISHKPLGGKGRSSTDLAPERD